MSKIISPYPPVQGLTSLSKESCWWRFRLRPNDDGVALITETDAKNGDVSTATWCSWEFFDGDSTVLDLGLDKPNCRARLKQRGPTHYLDILHAGPPTPAAGWNQLTLPGVFQHPDDEPEVITG